jgi:hypothetical protein
MSKADISFDSTLGSNYYYGYIYGTGLPFFLRLPGHYSKADILEFPLHIMDSVFMKGYGKEWRKGEPFFNIKHFFDKALEKYYSLLTINFHHFFLLNKKDHFNNFDLYQKIIDFAREKGLYFINLTQFNRFWRDRIDVKFESIHWEKSKGRLGFSIRSEKQIEGLTFILPKVFEGLTLENSESASSETIVQNGREYLMYDINLDKEMMSKNQIQYTRH